MSIARRYGAELIALHVIDGSDETKSKPLRVAKEMESQFRDWLDGIKLGQVTPQVEVWTGPLPRTILEMAHEVSADLLIMAADSRSKRRMKAPITYEVIRESQCPVLTIPKEGRGYERHHSIGNELPDGA